MITKLRILRPSLVLLLLVLPGILPSRTWAQGDDPPARVARLSYMKGNVSLQVAGASDWAQASLNYPLTTGDRLYTDQQSQVELEVGSTAVRMAEATDLTVANLTDQLLQLGIGQGTIRVRVFELSPGESVEVDTPNGALSLLQPGDYRVDSFPNDGSTLVLVNQGGLEVSGGNVQQRVGRGQGAKLTGTDPIQISYVELPNPDAFDAWCHERDRRFESAASARYVSRSVPGYYDLDQYGRWQDSPQYGPVWYPTAVPVGWVPYRYGRWVWVAPWGWTWVEDEPWGFCPFHYGRWAVVGGSWGWVPGPVVVRPYYAPALVAFVGGSHFSVAISVGQPVGWFPLGPREPFYPWYHHDDVYLRQVNVTNITNITNVTNINNITYVNKTVATTVVPGDTFRNGQPVYRHTVPIRPEQLAQAQVTPHPRMVPAGAALVGGKPAARPPRVLTPMAGRGAGGGVVSRPVPNQPPGMTRTGPPEQSHPGRPAPSRPNPNQPPQLTRTGPLERNAPGGPAPTSPRFITRNPLPPSLPPISARQPAMQEHPGRPLEPQQLRNLREGRSAGPMRDREFPPHASPPPKAPPERRQEKPAPRPSEKSGGRPRGM